VSAAAPAADPGSIPGVLQYILAMTHTRQALRGKRRMCAVALALSYIALAGPAAAGTLTRVAEFGGNPGNLIMYEYISASAPARAPLVMLLHGCAQSADQYLREAGWYELADRYGIVLVAAEQTTANNQSRCFNWFEPDDQARDRGEARSIASMVHTMMSKRGIDRDRVYVTGLSAGAAMTAVMLAAYPDVFKGGAIMSGIPYQCATSTKAAFGCMGGIDESPSAWGDLVRKASAHAGPWPVVSIWHGSSDGIVKSSNLTELVEQWTDVHGIDRAADGTNTVGNATQTLYRDASGAIRVETWLVKGMGHAVAIDPGSGAGQCGVAGSYASDQSVCASYRAALLWGLIPDSGHGQRGHGQRGGHTCTQYADNNYWHVEDGRAYQAMGHAYARGSNQHIGLYNVFAGNVLAEIAPGYYVLGNCP
jgi:poly(hydroxyalkanoate) depolymerase family esterase